MGVGKIENTHIGTLPFTELNMLLHGNTAIIPGMLGLLRRGPIMSCNGFGGCETIRMKHLEFEQSL